MNGDIAQRMAAIEERIGVQVELQHGEVLAAYTDAMTPPEGDLTKVTVRGLTMTCWKCHRPTTVVVSMHLAAAVNGDLVTCDDGQALVTAAEVLRVTGNVSLAQPIKTRSSQTTATTELTNGCQHCDALQATSSSTTRN